jgi:hypothetical protein
MDAFDPQAYGPVFAPLLKIDRRLPLDAGRPNTEAAAQLNKLSIDAAFAHARSEGGGTQPVDWEMAGCCVAGVWLLHNYLDESHTISQGIDTPSGSFWHAIMHRREGDFSNAKYWFRHVGQHLVFAELGQQAHVAASAAADADSSLKETRLRDGTWDPFAFVDLCQGVARGQTGTRELCLDVQQAEWELLFDFCYREAVGE